MRAITICVEFHDFLAITAPYNSHHFSEHWVITSTRDEITAEVCRHLRNDLKLPIYVVRTSKFYEGGAQFAKYAALELGLNVMERRGWIVHLDADILWPKSISPWEPEQGFLYSPQRRMFNDLTKPIPREADWPQYSLHPQKVEWAGYTQIYHADDPVLGPPPWHDTRWRHAGGGDSFFQAKWAADKKIRPPWNVLHLGQGALDWCGRVKPFLDGTTHPEAAKRLQELRQLIALRQRQPRQDIFKHERI